MDQLQARPLRPPAFRLDLIRKKSAMHGAESVEA
jgi:hypothetical protein